MLSSWAKLVPALALWATSPAVTHAAELKALPEWTRPDPFGGIISGDRTATPWQTAIRLKAARGGYASFHLVLEPEPGAAPEFSVSFPLPTDVYREWFHLTAKSKQYVPDALIPIRLPITVKVPDEANRIPGQKVQAFWVDIFIPPDAEVKTHAGAARFAGKSIPIELTVLQAKIPDRDAVTLDNNSYGTSWMLEQYPKTLAALKTDGGNNEALFRLIHDYHRIFYDHRGTFHQLGYGHAGKVGPEFAPQLSGEGRNKHIANWTLFDKHYGPLLDGSAFRDSRRGARPVPFIYLPVNPEWPASFLWWGEPGYEAEFVNVLSEMERHFREKNWTSTQFEVFFNHKKRYKGFNWDGDETRFEKDDQYLIDYARMLRKAIPADSPVHFVIRADASWSMERQFQTLKGVVGFWVTGEGMLSWYPEAAREVMARGDRVWTYGGTPAVEEVSTAIALNPLRSWISGVDGFVRWLTVSPGPDPWFRFEGGRETLVYPGEKFGVAGPLASIRLKLQRNCLQDLALLNRADKLGIQEEVVRRFNGSAMKDWRNSRPALADKPVLDWNNADIDDAMKPYESRFPPLKPDSWSKVHDYALELAR